MHIVPTELSPALEACKRATELQERGDYRAAVHELGGLWSGPGYDPNIGTLADSESAELLMIAGTLTGHLGSALQIPDAQELAKDLLTRATEAFHQLGLLNRFAEAQRALAVCYWRSGFLSESVAILQTVLSGPQLDNTARLRLMITLAMVEREAGRLKEALSIYASCQPLWNSTTSHYLMGTYHLNYALALKSAGENDRALIENTAASFYLEQSGHLRYQARVLNNIAVLLLGMHRLKEAQERAQEAEQIFKRLGDPGSVAQVLDTRARIHLAAGEFEDAEKTSGMAVQTLEGGDEKSVLVDAIVTKAVVLLKLRQRGAALRQFSKAIDEAENFLGEEAASRVATVLIEEMVGPAYLGAHVALETAVDGVEARIIREALELTAGRISRAASLLNVSHQGLDHALENRHQKLKSYRTPRRKSPIAKKVVRIR